jgi:uncharacterized protein (TIGR02145 family)
MYPNMPSISQICNIFITGIFITSFILLDVSCQRSAKENAGAIGWLQIGDQVWMDKNLSVRTFRNGDPIPEVRSPEDWVKAARDHKPAWCYYDNDATIGEEYGVMYNWYAVNDPRGLAPEGWHVPTDNDWVTLENYFGVSIAGTKMKCDTTSATLSGSVIKFCAPLGGYRTRDGNFTGLNEFTYLSGVTEDHLPEAKDKIFIWGRGLHVNNATAMRCGLDKEFGLYVRCVRDAE